MIAKFVSSARHYRMTQGALEHVHALGIDASKPIHIAKHIYGKDKPTLLEHMIPASIIKRALVDSDRKGESIDHVLLNAGQVVIVLRTEDERLIAAGLRSKMPPDWNGFGDDPVKRYNAAGITLSEVQIIHEGPICR